MRPFLNNSPTNSVSSCSLPFRNLSPKHIFRHQRGAAHSLFPLMHGYLLGALESTFLRDWLPRQSSSTKSHKCPPCSVERVHQQRFSPRRARARQCYFDTFLTKTRSQIPPPETGEPTHVSDTDGSRTTWVTLAASWIRRYCFNKVWRRGRR